MALVDYSGSDSDSNDEGKANPKPSFNKPAFQKVVDRSNPHKIKVSLPEPARATAQDEELESSPPAKRAKTGPGGMGGFNSFLPAPKRAAAPSEGPGVGARRGGLASGVSLKTGSAPGFSREPAPSAEESSDLNGGFESPLVEESQGNSRASDTIESAAEATPGTLMPSAAVESKKKSTMFKPLSVANKKPQKKKVSPTASLGATGSMEVGTMEQMKAKPKASLFSSGDDAQGSSSDTPPTKGAYQPMVYHTDKPKTTPTTDPNPEDPSIPQDYTAAESTYPPSQPEQAQQSQTLSAIATDLNLSASARRQLLGRHHKSNQSHPSDSSHLPKIVNFNTDAEYAANELLRQAGETVQHNPVRGIAPGKHSLKQLVNAASNQKDALEEHFASGRRNKKEAGSKYGW